jgi:DNA-binding MarR family transcriptional regulator
MSSNINVAPRNSHFVLATLDQETFRRNQFVLDVWWRVNRFLRAGVEGRHAVDSLNATQFRIMRGLADGSLSMTAVAKIAGVTRGTATRMVDGLVARTLVTRFGDPSNRRLVLVRLTAKGKRLQQQVHVRGLQRLARLTRDLDDGEKRELERLLGSVAQALEQEPG